jgi:hypothetical protein
MKMFKLTRPLDKQGVSVVLGAILILGIGIAVGSLVYSEYVQSSIHSSEASHMADVESNFLKLKTGIASSNVGESTDVSIPMNPTFPFFVPTQGEVGTVSFREGISFLQSAGSITIENGMGHVSGSLNALKQDDYNYIEVNSEVFHEIFYDTSAWTENTVHDDNATVTPSFDKEVTNTADASGSISVSTIGFKGDNKMENAYWTHDFGDLLDNYPNVTLEAYYKKIFNYVGSVVQPPNAVWSLDVENYTGYTTVYDNDNLYAHQENTLISGTTYLSLKTENADTTGINLSASTADNGRQLLGSFVYPLAGISTIPADNWNFYYRAWESTPPSGIVYDAENSSYTTGSTYLSWLHPVGENSNRLIIVSVGISKSTGAPTIITSITCAGENMKLVDNALEGTDPQVRVYTYQCLNPPSGPDNIMVNFAASTQAVGGSVSFGNVDQTTPIEENNVAVGYSSSNQPVTESVVGSSLGTGRIAYSSIFIYNTSSPYPSLADNASWTQQWNQTSQHYQGDGLTIPVNSGNVTASWTTSKGTSWGAQIAIIKPAPPPPVLTAHIDVSIRIRKSDGTWTTIADNVASSENITSLESTLSASYHFPGTVFNQSDYLEIDYYCHVTTAAPGTAYLKIDNNSLSNDNQTRITNVQLGYIVPAGLHWNPNVLLYQDNGDIASYPFLPLISGSAAHNVKAIRAYMGAQSWTPNAQFANTVLDLWMDDISVLAGPPFHVVFTMTSQPIVHSENVDNIIENLSFWSQDYPAYYTLQIRNFASNQWEILGPYDNVLVGENKIYWDNILTNPENYIDNYSHTIKLRMTGYSANSPFRLRLDWLNFKLNYNENYENYYLAYFGAAGKITFTMNNYSYPNQTYTYEDGAVILSQNNSSIIVSKPQPALVVAKTIDNQNIEVDVNHYVIVGSEGSISRRGYTSIRASVVDYYSPPEIFSPNRSEVIIEIDNSPFTDDAWYNYLLALNNDFNAKGYHSSLNGLTLTIQGIDNVSNNPDIYFYETTTSIEVSLG